MLYELSLIIPTRNEAANAALLASSLSLVLSGTSYEIIVVDDSSDETPRLLSSLGSEYGLNLTVVHREEGERSGGLSSAVLEGVRRAGGTYVGVMDADLQHPPSQILSMLSHATENGADIVIASRYVRGGTEAGLSSPFRKLVSFTSRWLVKLLFADRLRSVSDPLSGFFVARRDLFDETSLRPIGFKILLDVLVRAHWRRLDEVALRFAPRANGSSKATLAQGRDFLSHVVSLVWEVRLGKRSSARRPP